MSRLEPFSKRLALVSLLAIVALQLVVHTDATMVLRATAIAAFAIGWLAARADARLHLLWLFLAPMAPAVLRVLSGREGPILDMFWMAGLSALLVRRASWSSWSLPPEWRVFAAGWAVTVSLAWPVLVAREAGFDLALLTDHGAINSSGLLSAPQAISWIVYVAWMHLLGLLWLDWACGEFTSRSTLEPVYAMTAGVTLAGLVAIYQGLVDISFLSTPFWAETGRATATMLDANAYGMCAAVAAPIAFALFHTRGAVAYGIGAMVLNLAGMWMSGSQTAALAGVLGTASVCVAQWRQLTPSARRPFAVAIVTASAVLVIALSTVPAIGPLRRLAELLDTPRAAFAAAINRGEYGHTAVEIIRDYPLTGGGIGSYQILSADYWRAQADDRLAFDNAQNWWRHEATELGLLGGLTLFVWSGMIAWTVMTARADPGDAMRATIVRGVLIAFGICSIVQMPTHAPFVLLWFMTLLAWFTSTLRLPPPARPSPGNRHRMASIAVLVLAVAYAAAHAVLAAGPLNVAERARRLHRPYVVGAYAEERLSDSRTFRWTREKTRLMLPAPTPWAVVQLWASHPDIHDRPVTVALLSPCGVVHTVELKTPDSVPIGVTLPPDADVLDLTVRVSRTWSPADHGSADSRELGVGITTDFIDDPKEALSLNRTVKWPDCR